MGIRGIETLAYGEFARIRDGDSMEILRSMVREESRAVESETLEFKELLDRHNEKEVSAKWSKQLSAFGNAGGGVLIWGIMAKKVDGVDAAQELRPIREPEAFASRLRSLLHGATDPPLSGVELFHVLDPDSDGRGFVICFIPPGELVPYRAERSDRQYYLRINGSSEVPQRATLARLFYPHSLCRLRLRVKIRAEQKPMQGGYMTVLKYYVELKNTGSATAHDVLLHAWDNLVRGPNDPGLSPCQEWQRVGSDQTKTVVRCLSSIHPGLPTDVLVSQQWNPNDWSYQSRLPGSVGPLIEVSFNVFARDTPPTRHTVRFVPHEAISRSETEKTCEVSEIETGEA